MTNEVAERAKIRIFTLEERGGLLGIVLPKKETLRFTYSMNSLPVDGRVALQNYVEASMSEESTFNDRILLAVKVLDPFVLNVVKELAVDKSYLGVIGEISYDNGKVGNKFRFIMR